MGIVLVVMLAVSCTGQQMLKVVEDRSSDQPKNRRLICQQQIMDSKLFEDIINVPVEWYRSETLVKLDSRVSASGASLEIMQAHPKDEDNYTCCINNRTMCSSNLTLHSK